VRFSSILVKFDQNGNLVTLKGEAYTPTGDTRVNFVGHGADLKQEGAQSLANKVKIAILIKFDKNAGIRVFVK
jgi:hypothetical protein